MSDRAAYGATNWLPMRWEKGKKPLQGDLPEVVELSRLVFTDTFTDQNWNSVAGGDMLTSVAFEEDGDGTRLSIITHFASAKELEAAEVMGMVEGYTDTLERFEDEISLYIKGQ